MQLVVKSVLLGQKEFPCIRRLARHYLYPGGILRLAQHDS
jgi:hypothetical protein